MTAASPTLVWLRDDLRLADNPALAAAAERGGPVVLVYLLDEVSHGIRPLGSASRWWLHHSLAALAATAPLVLRRGPAEEVIPALVAETDAGAVFWNRRYGASRAIDARLKQRLRDDGIDVASFHANLLFEPWTVTTAQGEPYRVFTPFWRAALEHPVRAPLPVPTVEWGHAASERLDDWALLPTRPDWAAGLRDTWTPGERGARERLEAFAERGLADYHRRDEPGAEATSRLSAHLRFGELSPFQVWHAVEGRHANAEKFLSELGWREFNAGLLFRLPELATTNVKAQYDAFPWAEPDPAVLDAWRRGRTGIPLVDAGMRELWHTGTMHNRVRMVAASLLVKNLLVHWRVGEQWFWDTLVDADEASNPGNWQWVAGCGLDAAPYFRVFNPVLQAARFDPDGEYVRRWVPEFGTPDYPEPIVDLGASRTAALAAYERVKAAVDRR
ncbi:deoxyribodipyrimidine photo-lyase [Leifsonia sp. H3M29-4]|uniref:cryptochrome/photolyase family protein n=1 Tax=Salinibacterium metalliresistens TaxID=3031321 RepID=UPI0023DC76BD|nr:deoxyribodipyrimidine photo-lyase [Salinibacterium metalliresistens]MDF1477926.1 deoxyribodipyrimidine photo-lyase [Salinibacterium metalliresistens]